MATDKLLMRELKLLQDELSTSQRERREKPVAPTATDSGTSATAGAAAGAVEAAPAARPDLTAREQELRVELHDLVSEIKEFLETAEKNIAAHPTTSVLAALLLGILIGRTLGGRS